MIQKNVWSYIQVGTGFRYLQEAQKGRSLNGGGTILENIERFLNNLADLGLPVTDRAAYRLKSLDVELKEKAEENDKAKLTEEDAKKLREIIRELRPTLIAESQGLYSYIIVDKRFNTDKLLWDIGGLFTPDVYSALPEMCQYDFQEAGRCISFNRSTAGAFHLMRAVESMVGIYYKKYIRPAKKGLTWGQMTHALDKKSRGKLPNETTMNQLGHIRVAFRNPTQHPEKIYDIEEVQDLLFLSIDVTNRMVSELN